MKESLGMIETIGYTAAIRAADMMVKCAYVEIVSIEKTGGGYVSVLIKGDVSSVHAAIEIGSEYAQGCGELVAAHVISKPFGSVGDLFKIDESKITSEEKPKVRKKTKKKEQAADQGEDEMK